MVYMCHIHQRGAVLLFAPHLKHPRIMCVKDLIRLMGSNYHCNNVQNTGFMSEFRNFNFIVYIFIIIEDREATVYPV